MVAPNVKVNSVLPVGHDKNSSIDLSFHGVIFRTHLKWWITPLRGEESPLPAALVSRITPVKPEPPDDLIA
jgi:hypothetical protein